MILFGSYSQNIWRKRHRLSNEHWEKIYCFYEGAFKHKTQGIKMTPLTQSHKGTVVKTQKNSVLKSTEINKSNKIIAKQTKHSYLARPHICTVQMGNLTISNLQNIHMKLIIFHKFFMHLLQILRHFPFFWKSIVCCNPVIDKEKIYCNKNRSILQSL